MQNACIFIVPVYNEESSIKRVIESIISSPLNSSISRIIVIDDGSTDKTPEILKELKDKYRIIHIITHPANAGISEVFYNGINEAIKNASDDDIVFILEGDNTNDPEIIPQMAKKINEGYDMVIASRFIKGGGFSGFPLHRKLIGWAGNLILRWVFKINGITDYTIFFRAYRAEVLKRVMEKYGERLFETSGFVVNTELLVKSSQFCRKITEVPHFYNYTRKKEASKFNVMENIILQLNFIISNFKSRRALTKSKL